MKNSALIFAVLAFALSASANSFDNEIQVMSLVEKLTLPVACNTILPTNSQTYRDIIAKSGEEINLYKEDVMALPEKYKVQVLTNTRGNAYRYSKDIPALIKKCRYIYLTETFK